MMNKNQTTLTIFTFIKQLLIYDCCGGGAALSSNIAMTRLFSSESSLHDESAASIFEDVVCLGCDLRPFFFLPFFCFW